MRYTAVRFLSVLLGVSIVSFAHGADPKATTRQLCVISTSGAAAVPDAELLTEDEITLSGSLVLVHCQAQKKSGPRGWSLTALCPKGWDYVGGGFISPLTHPTKGTARPTRAEPFYSQSSDQWQYATNYYDIPLELERYNTTINLYCKQ